MDADETTVLISSNSQQITDDITNYVGDERKKAVTNGKFKLPMCNVHTSLTFIKAICAIICIVTLCGVSITLPILSQSILLSGYCHSNQYYTLISCDIWFPVAFWLAALMVKLYNPSFSFKSYTSHRVFVLLGLLEALNAVFVVYASPPNRTTPSLQVILRSLRIPYTVVLSYIVLHKSSGAGRLICTLGTLIGLFISFEPNIFNIDNQYDHHAGESLVWPIIFGLAYLPNSLSTVLQEREIKKDSMEEALIFEAWLQTYKVFYFGLVFWVEFIPGFGEKYSRIDQEYRNRLLALELVCDQSHERE
ncbi:uncharacterized protein TRIADDRAFT_57458 [Trichoplax adhaerens]|uniref:Sugar phosphate transporter domain-containing protein n=1 Tax=Trichoplax adhaerens TaxID=10228 RepID=B3RZH8_TRIAD|nr:hypothetical protein TRIADDRAFT_57458 [Trichoplax adhaerens]EDV24209.1 hypothetical protein TRIADDRAFT_57458 [Trichoplax adhaerens]|eukprot:XP_002113735.1 hypothetical protein TRIADDRAFT_57458 [Trichoplax adhaerens]